MSKIGQLTLTVLTPDPLFPAVRAFGQKSSTKYGQAMGRNDRFSAATGAFFHFVHHRHTVKEADKDDSSDGDSDSFLVWPASR